MIELRKDMEDGVRGAAEAAMGQTYRTTKRLRHHIFIQNLKTLGIFVI